MSTALIINNSNGFKFTCSAIKFIYYFLIFIKFYKLIIENIFVRSLLMVLYKIKQLLKYEL